MEFSDRDPIPKWDFQEPGARLKPWLRELSFWRHDTSIPVNKQCVKLYKSLPLGTIGRSLADQFSEDQICSGQGFDLIIGAIRHHFRSYLEAEPEVQAETALYQSTRSPTGTFVEYTSRISNKLREMESGFKVLLPPKVKGSIIKRQAKLTHDQAKHLHFYIPTRGLEADRMVDALNRLDRRIRLWNKYSETEQSWSTMLIVVTRNITAMRRRIRWKLKLPRHPSRTTTITTTHLRTQRVISWIGGQNGSTLVPVQREGPLEEDEASSLTAWAQGYREVRKNLRDSVTGRGYYKPESSRNKKVVRKTMFENKTPRRDRNIRTPFRDKARDHSTERITVAELRKRTQCYRCRQLGHMARECQNPAPKDIPQSSAKNFLLPGGCLCTVA